jgi:ankyrin repeat protein
MNINKSNFKTLIISVIILINNLVFAQQNREKYKEELFEAIIHVKLDIVKKIIESDPLLLETKDSVGNTPLLTSCLFHRNDILYYLIDKGANVNAKNSKGITPLFAAITNNYNYWGEVNPLKKLIENGADIRTKLNYKLGELTILQAAVESSAYDNVKLLINKGADIDAKGIRGTALQIAIMNQDTLIAELLIKNDAKLQEFSYGNTELHLAAIQGCTKLIPLLLNYGIDVDQLNDYNHTPLYYACMHGHYKTAELLIAAGADKKNISEENYTKAVQLDKKLSDKEAFLWSLKGDGYAVKTKNHLLIFSPKISNHWSYYHGPSFKLTNGYFNTNELEGQNITFLLSGIKTFTYAEGLMNNFHRDNAKYIHNTQPIYETEFDLDETFVKANDTLTIDSMRVFVVQADLTNSMIIEKKLGYLIETDGLKIYYASNLSSKNDSSQMILYKQEIDKLKLHEPIDFVILKVRNLDLDLDYEPYLYLIDALCPKAIYLTSNELVNEEQKNCLQVLQTKDVPVYFPEGGIATGQRFFYKKL